MTAGVRPEGMRVVDEGGLEATVEVVEELGSESFLYCRVLDGDVPVVARTEGLSSATLGDRISLQPQLAAVHLFDTATGARLPD